MPVRTTWAIRSLSLLAAAIAVTSCSEAPTGRKPEGVSLVNAPGCELTNTCGDGGEEGVFGAGTNTILTASATSVAFGQPITLTAEVRAEIGTTIPTGVVSFFEFGIPGQNCAAKNGVQPLGTDSEAPYMITFASLTPGQHSISACFVEAGTVWKDSNAQMTLTVGRAASLTALSAAPDPANAQATIFTTVVSAAQPIASVPGGLVTLYEFATDQSCTEVGTATALGSGTLTDGTTQITVNLTPGDHAVTACYAGDSTFEPSSDATDTTPAKVATKTSGFSVPGTAVTGQLVQLNVFVERVDELDEVASGRVDLRIGGTNCADATFVRLLSYRAVSRWAGVSRFSGSATPYTYRACYGGDDSHAASEGELTVVVNPAGTQTTLTVSPAEPVYGDDIALTTGVSVEAPGEEWPSTTIKRLTIRELNCLGSVVKTIEGEALPRGVSVPIADARASSRTLVACFSATDDYRASSKDLALTVAPAPLRIVAPTATKVSGTSFTITPSYEGFVRQETASTAGVFTTAPTCTSAGSAASAAPGEYPVICSGAVAPNYTITYVAGNLTVSAVPTTIAVTAAPTQYSDKIRLRATVTPTTPIANTPLTGTVDFIIDGTSAGTSTLTNGAASLSVSSGNYPPGPHTYTARFHSTSIAYTDAVANTTNYTIAKEDASIMSASSNVGAINVSQPSVALGFSVKETFPEPSPSPDPDALAAPGDISRAALSARLVGVASNAIYNGSCTAGAVSGSGYSATRPFTCTFVPTGGASAFQIDAYTVEVAVGGNYYSGSYADVLAVFDPAAGFVSGGGKFIDPADGLRVSFGMGFTYTGKGKTGFRGGWVVVKHLPDGGSCRVKSNTMNPPSVTGTTASLSGKSNYACVNALGETTLTAGNLSAVGYVEDNGTSGAGQDKFWIRAYGKLLMPLQARDNAVLLTGGNIQVPKSK